MRKFVILLLLVAFPAINTFSAVDSVPEADSGNISVGNWDFSQSDLLLHGTWEFYWDTLIYPGAFDTLSDPGLKTYIPVNITWSSKKAGSWPVKGKATYRLKINTGGLDGIYGIRLYDYFTSARIFFDGRMIYQSGKPGNSRKTSKPGFVYADVPLFLDKDHPDHELVAQVANFYHTRSGIVKPVRFGKFERLVDESRNWLILILLVVGIILFISTNHLLNYFLYKNEITHLLFGLLCLVMIIRNISTNQRILTYLFTDMNWQLLFKLDNFSGFGTIPLFAIFLSVLYRKEFPKLILYIFVGIGAAITLFVFVTPQLVYGRFRMFYELYILTGGLFLTFYVLLRAAIRKRDGALLTFIGFFVLYATAINDVLISMGLVGGVEVAPFGLIIYMLLQSFVLSRGSAQAVEENRILGIALKEEKQLLEKRVSERTKELEERNQEIIEQQEILKNQSWLNDSLAKINVVLNTYNKSDIQALSDHLVSEVLEILQAQVGVMYLVNDDEQDPVLELSGTKNASKDLLERDKIVPGEGLLGACYLDRESKLFNNVSDSYIKLDSGLGKTQLKNLILIPLHTNEQPLGVIEIASYNPFDERQKELLDKISESISSTIQFLKLNNRNLKLLKEYKEKQSILEQNEEDMEQYMMELEALRQELEELQKKKS